MQYEGVRDAVIEKLEVSIEEVQGRHGKGKIKDARNMICSIRYHYCRATLDQIAKELGGRNHTTILSNIRTHKDSLATDPEYRNQYIEIVLKLFSHLIAEIVIRRECKKIVC